MNQNYISALSAIKDIVQYDLIPPLQEIDLQDTDVLSKLTSVNEHLIYIKNFLDNIRPNYWGIFTVPPSTAISADGQIIPFSVSFGGVLTNNPDGSINIPPNSDYIIDFVISATFSVTNRLYLKIFDADTGQDVLTSMSVSENYNAPSDYASVFTSVLNSGENGRRLLVKVHSKQTSGTATLNQYSTYIKLTEV